MTSDDLYSEVIKAPEPQEIDQELALKLSHLTEDAMLRANPFQDERCNNCLFYLDADAGLSYCWHPKLRVLVGNDWWCQWWEQLPTD
jgi:hypothetical protein